MQKHPLFVYSLSENYIAVRALLYFSSMAWKDHFAFNKKQRNGIMLLLSLIGCLIVFLIINDFLPPTPATIDFSAFRSDMNKMRFKQKDTTAQIEPGKETELKPAINSPIEINTADSSDFEKFALVSPKVARTIVRFRNALGGYYKKEQLLEVYGMDTACYNSMLKNITLDPGKVEKLDINKATEKAFTHHPYIHKKLAKAIYNYRRENGGFKDIAELMKVEGMDKALYLKLTPYLSITK